MNYTIRISDTGKQAQSIINMLKELSSDYPFISVFEEDLGLSEEMEKEFDSRYEFVMKNKELGKSWEEVKSNLLSK
jgi:hypothetical protein